MQESTLRFLKRITEDKEDIILLPVASPLSPSKVIGGEEPVLGINSKWQSSQ
jgi:hypothetical protein